MGWNLSHFPHLHKLHQEKNNTFFHFFLKVLLNICYVPCAWLGTLPTLPHVIPQPTKWSLFNTWESWDSELQRYLPNFALLGFHRTGIQIQGSLTAQLFSIPGKSLIPGRQTSFISQTHASWLVLFSWYVTLKRRLGLGSGSGRKSAVMD